MWTNDRELKRGLLLYIGYSITVTEHFFKFYDTNWSPQFFNKKKDWMKQANIHVRKMKGLTLAVDGTPPT